MTHDEMIAVIAAHRDGLQIQYLMHTDKEKRWRECGDPIWNFDKYDYRVAPEKPLQLTVEETHYSGGVQWFVRHKKPHRPYEIGTGQSYEMIELTPEVLAACEAAGIDVEAQT